MGHLNISFDKTINGMRYIIKKYRLSEEEQLLHIESSIPNDTPMVYSIKYCEETKTFQMTDYVNVCGRKIKVMFNLNLSLNIVGFTYNDLDGSYDMINPSNYFADDIVMDTNYVYHEYLKRLTARLSKFLENQENSYNDNNYKMLSLENKNNN